MSHALASVPSGIAVIVPVYQAAPRLEAFLSDHAGWLQNAEVVVVEGVASGQTPDPQVAHMVQQCGHILIRAPVGRGQQIASGLRAATADWFWVLHADSDVPEETFRALATLCQQQAQGWGRFDVLIPGLSIIAWFMNWRSRLTRICTGDQGMFFSRQTLAQAGGFADIPLMEDIETSRRLKRCGHPFHALPERVQTSARRWRQRGVVRTVLTMWWFRLRYFSGTSADVLYRDYYR